MRHFGTILNPKLSQVLVLSPLVSTIYWLSSLETLIKSRVLILHYSLQYWLVRLWLQVIEFLRDQPMVCKSPCKSGISKRGFARTG